MPARGAMATLRLNAMPKTSRRPKQLRTIAAIHPNRGVQAWYWNELERLIRSAHGDLLRQLERPAQIALDGKPRTPSGLVREDGSEVVYDASSPITRLDKVLKRWGERWAGKFDKAANKLAKQFAAKSFTSTNTAFRAALSSAGFTVRFKTTKASLESFRATVAENVGLIKSIQQQFHTKVQGDVWRAVTRGSDLSTLSKSLRESYDITTKRAALIARDQNAKAKATIENTRRAELGITQAIWQHSSAGKKKRRTHVAMNNKVFDIRKGMWDEDEQEWVLPGQLINCLCTSRAIIPGLEES